MENYEQKYKEALGWMQSLYKGLHGITKEDAEHYFPELKESEDERIRKELIEFVKSRGGFKHEYIVWLEKQGGEKSEENEGNLGGISSNWSEEDEKMIETICKEGNLKPSEQHWLKSLKDRVQPQPKQEWSEYDEIQLSEAIQMIEANGTWIRSEDAVKKVSNWLKSLKSLKPNHWKPSEEQMQALKKRTYGLHNDSDIRKALESLIGDLTKL